jgi:macrolide-specific efflux system membrane fusion protein
MIKSKYTKIIGVILVLVIGYFSYTKIFAKKTTVPQYQTAQAEKGTLIVSLTTSGSVAATNSRTVTTTASGVVQKVYVKEGQKVSTGTPLMLIDLDLNGRQQLQSAYAQLQSAQNSLVSAQTKMYSLDSSLVNAKNIFNNQWANQSPDDVTYIQKHDDLLTAQANYDAQAAAIKQSQTSLYSAQLSYQLASATVYAPISGTVSAISLAPGMILNPTSNSSNSTNVANKIAIVKTAATPAISVSLTEVDVTKVKVGDKATITLDALPDKTYTGKVIAVDTSGSVSSGVVSYTTTIQLDSNVEEILSNMSATANIITDVIDNVVMVPVAAVQTTNGTTTVRVLKNGQLSNIDVVVGKSSTTQTEIVSGINEGDTVITSVVTSSATTGTTRSGSNSVFGSFGGGSGGGARIIGR